MKLKITHQKKLVHLSLILILAVSGFAQQRQREQSRNVPSVDRLRAHISYLASDELEGRRTGTRGAEGAAYYIAKEFARYKLRPGFDVARTPKDAGEYNSRYMQKFPFIAGIELGAGNAMLFTPRAASAGSSNMQQETRAASLDLRLAEDWTPLGFSLNSRVEDAPAVFVGYGITATDLRYDDYAGVDAAGRIAIAFAGMPDGGNPHSDFARYADARWKAIAARDHGARALLVIASEENFKDDRLSRLRYDNTGGDAGIPVAAISRQAAARILVAGGLAPLADLEKALREKRENSSATNPHETRSEQSHQVSAPLKDVTLSITTNVVRRESKSPAMNVVGVIEGSDPVLKDEAIIIGAHYDHLGRGGEGSLATREGDIHHGADDNASGVAGLLELARLFTNDFKRPRRTLIFIAFSGEEEGLLGSSFYVNHPVVPLKQTIAMINMDMIGRMKENRLIIGGVGTSPQWKDWIAGANLDLGMIVNVDGDYRREASSASVPIVIGANNRAIVSLDPSKQLTLNLNEDGYGPSDHSSFYSKQIPVLFFWTGTHDDYHKPSDVAEKINYEGEARILTLVRSILRALDQTDKRPAYTVARSNESQGRSTGFRVYLGTIPSYADSTSGVKLDGVREDSPAARAGLRANDVIVKLAGREIRNIYDYTYTLGEMKAGQEYEIEVIRGTERLQLKITPAVRK